MVCMCSISTKLGNTDKQLLMEPERKTLLDLEGGGRPPAGGSPAPSAPPREAIAPPPYPGRGGYGGVVSEQPFAPPSYNIASHANHVGVKPPNYMALNAFIALCCCLLCGLMGLNMGLQIEEHWKQGNRELAYKRSKNAKRCAIGGIIFGVIVYIIILIIVLFIVVTVAKR
ncbi:uncharacterized protein LOC135347493 [Halichondria panicea]|uniref:uncharacterized protein LOC135347493 n=1 Tax=Halichondria panicea TaxID=6063 RepID=UPI00312B7942